MGYNNSIPSGLAIKVKSGALSVVFRQAQ